MIKISILKTSVVGESRVAATPETIKKLIKLGCTCAVEHNAGLGSNFVDQHYRDAGAEVTADRASLLQGAKLVLAVNFPTDSKALARELQLIPQDAILIGLLNPYNSPDILDLIAKTGITSCALELMPRITRAQSMDVLSSQSNLVGYYAVIAAAANWKQAFPMMMTAAGTIAPAKVLVLGAGVAGLQAIATAKRLGAVVSAFDVRPAVKEQVESLGGKFIEVEADTTGGETAGGYAKEMSAEYKQRQAKKIAEAVQTHDIVITTALIPGKPAPKLITTAMVESMHHGSIIIDLAAAAGGNCEVTTQNQPKTPL